MWPRHLFMWFSLFCHDQNQVCCPQTLHLKNLIWRKRWDHTWASQTRSVLKISIRSMTLKKKKKNYIYRHGTIEHKETRACKSSLRPTTFTNTWVIFLKRRRGKHVVAKLQWSVGGKSSRMDGKNVFVIGCLWPSRGWSNTLQWQWIWNCHPFRLWNVLQSLNTVPTGALDQWLQPLCWHRRTIQLVHLGSDDISRMKNTGRGICEDTKFKQKRQTNT